MRLGIATGKIDKLQLYAMRQRQSATETLGFGMLAAGAGRPNPVRPFALSWSLPLGNLYRRLAPPKG